MKKIISFIALSLMTISSFAAEKIEHIVERGETIESIAKKYNVSEQALIDANPSAKTLFYAGMILTIPDAQIVGNNSKPQLEEPVLNLEKKKYKDSEQTYRRQRTDSEPAVTNTIGVAPKDFDNFFISYDASFDSFDKGAYGIGFLSNQSSGTSGFGFTMSFHTDLGVTSARNAQTTFKLGPTYDYVVAPNIMLSAILRGSVGSYKKATEEGKTKEKWGVGVTLTPSMRFKLNKVILGLGYEFGWAQKQKKMLHNASITLGIYVK